MAVTAGAYSLDPTKAVGLSRNFPYFDPTQDWTRCMWVYAPTTTSPNYYTVFAWWYDNETWYVGSFLYFGSPTDPYPSQWVVDIEFNDPSAEFAFTQVPVTEAVWHHFAYRFTAATRLCEIFVDGVNRGSVTVPSTLISDLTPTMDEERLLDDGGGLPGISAAYDRVWNTALTDAEIWLEMSSTSARVTTNLEADTPLSSATDLADVSGNDYDWSVRETVSTTDSPTLPRNVFKQWRLYRFDYKPREEETR